MTWICSKVDLILELFYKNSINSTCFVCDAISIIAFTRHIFCSSFFKTISRSQSKLKIVCCLFGRNIPGIVSDQRESVRKLNLWSALWWFRAKIPLSKQCFDVIFLYSFIFKHYRFLRLSVMYLKHRKDVACV